MALLSKSEVAYRKFIVTDQEYILQEVDTVVSSEEQEEKDGKPREFLEETRQIVCESGAFQEEIRRSCETQDDEARHLKGQQNQYSGLLEHQNR